MAVSATTIVVPPPDHRFVDPQTGKIDEVWLRMLNQLVTGANTASTVYTFNGLAPTTTEGDMIYYTAGGNARLPVGTALQVLGSDGTDPTWQSPYGKLLASGNAAGTTLDIVLTSYTAYRALVFILQVVPQTDNTSLLMRFSTNGGSSYIASGYNWTLMTSNDSGASNASGSGSDTAITISAGNGNGATEGAVTTVTLFSQATATLWTKMTHMTYSISADATPAGHHDTGGGSQEAAQDTDAVRFLYSSGNIASGTYAVYGLP